MNKRLNTFSGFLSGLLLLVVTGSANGQTFRRAFNPASSYCRDMVQTTDGGFVMAGGIETGGKIFLQRTNSGGFLEWTNHLTLNGAMAKAVCATGDGSFGVLCENYADAGLLKNVVLKIAADGTVLWQKVIDNGTLFNGFKDIVGTADGGFAIAGDTRVYTPDAEQDVRIVKLDASGGQIWSTIQGYAGANEVVSRLIEMPNGDLVVSGDRRPLGLTESDIFLLRTDAVGNLVWKNLYAQSGYQNAKDLLRSPNGEIVVLAESFQVDPAAMAVLKTDGSGTQLLYKLSYPLIFGGGGTTAAFVNCFASDNGGNLYVPVFDEALKIVKLNSAADTSWVKATNISDIPYAIAITQDNYFAIAGETVLPGQATLLKTDINGAYLDFFNYLSGKVYLDENADCSYDSTENTPLFFIVEAKNQFGESFYKPVGSDGNWTMAVSEGDFSIIARPVGSLPDLWTVCDTPVVNTTGIGQSFPVAPIGAKIEVECPYLEVHLTAGAIRRCTTAYYTVEYCNYGTKTATNAYVEITGDPLLSYEYSSVPLTSQNGNTLVFALGDVPAGSCENFVIRYHVSCDAVNGQTICNEAHIYPDSLCGELNGTWDNSHLEVSGSCNGLEVKFVITNTGIGNMNSAVDYVIIEDQIMLFEGSIQLDALEDTTITISNPSGYSYYLQTEQTAGHPGENKPAAAVEMCAGSGVSLALQLPSGDEDAFSDTYCDQVTGSYDPNDKRGFPLGWKAAHLIEPGQDIDYQIRFQNTGTDTAFLVIVRDPLPENLDVNSVRPGPASHPYTYSIEQNGDLKFTFNNILLPDSTTNEAGSHGFVQFSVRPKADLPLGTVLENSAAIYFDFNDPVITNTTFHTLGQPMLTLLSDVHIANDFGVRILPNPVSNQATLVIDGCDAGMEKSFTLYDAIGTTYRREDFSGNQYTFNRFNLPAGMYFYRFQTASGQISTGKLLLAN